MEKRTERSCWDSSAKSSGEVGKGSSPRPPISMLGLPASRVRFLQTFVLSGTIWGGGVPNVEIGARGNVLFLRQKNASRDVCFIFSKYCPPSVPRRSFGTITEWRPLWRICVFSSSRSFVTTAEWRPDHHPGLSICIIVSSSGNLC